MELKHETKEIQVVMPSQTVVITCNVLPDLSMSLLNLDIKYDHPTTGIRRGFSRRPLKASFSQKHFDKELESYIVQEAMSDLTDNRHVYDWIE